MDLFDFNNDDIEKPRYIPLAEKMRPSSLDEFYGQKHLLGPSKILRKIIEDEYNLMSAFIKSMRDSQTDTALYWLAGMIHSGVDPAYIARIIIVHLVEDVGMASPQTLNIAVIK